MSQPPPSMSQPSPSTSQPSPSPRMQHPKILVTGANGQLGSVLQVIAGALFPDTPATDSPALATDSPASTSSPFIFCSRATLPIEDRSSVNDFFAANRPKYVINCAAYTAVDKAESEKAEAFRINGDAVGYLATACRDTGARLIHLSTDYVFDGRSSTPLKEGDPTAPVNIYGASKLAGEKLALQEYPAGSLIIRTSWVYSEFGNNFVKTMIRLMKERTSINVVSDQIGSPTYAADLAAAILHIINAPAFIPGIFNYSNEGQISWYEFAAAIRERTHSTCAVNPITTAQYPTPAARPHYSLLDKSLITSTYDLTIPDWQTGLNNCLHRLHIS